MTLRFLLALCLTSQFLAVSLAPPARSGQAYEETPASGKSRPAEILSPAAYRKAVSASRPRYITLDVLKKEMSGASPLVLLDLREKSEFERGHIKGAKSLGPDVREELLRALVPSKGTKVVIYCTNTLFPSRQISLVDVAFPQLEILGYKNVFVLEEVWKRDNKGIDFEDSAQWQSSK